MLHLLELAGIPNPPPREMALAAWLRFRDQLREEWPSRGLPYRMWAEKEFEDADKTPTP